MQLTELMVGALQKALANLPQAAALLCVLVVAVIALYRTARARKIDFPVEMTEKDNVAASTTVGLFILGIAVALSAVIVDGLSTPLPQMVTWVIGAGVLSTLLVIASAVVNDKLILGSFSVTKEIFQDRNVGTAFVVGATFLGSGIVINGALDGHSDSLFQAFADVMFYWAVGQVLFVVAAWLFTKTRTYNLHKAIEDDDNAAAGLSFGGFIVGVAMIVGAAFRGAGSAWLDETAIALPLFAFGVFVMILFNVVIDKVVLPNSSLAHEIKTDKNIGAAAVSAAGSIATGLIIAQMINTFPAA